MPLKIEAATPADIKYLVPAQYDAFHPMDEMHVIVYPSPVPPTPEIIQRTNARQEKTFTESNVYWVKVVDDKTGEIVAGARWYIYPEADQKRWGEKAEATWILEEDRGKGNAGGGIEDAEYVGWVMEEVYQRRREKIRGPAAVLDLLFVAPAHHRRGAGSMLAQWGLAKADELGVKSFVEASTAGRAFYESCGFVVTEYVDLDGGDVKDEWASYGKIPFIWMEKEASKKSFE